MKKILRLFLILSLICCNFALSFGHFAVAEEQFVYLGGISAGFSVETQGADVIGLSDVITENGIISPSKNAKLQVGDAIISIDGIKTDNALDIENAVKDGKPKLLVIKRNNETLTVQITPAKDITGKYRLGVFIRDFVNGIGTITYFTDTEFASLGHPIVNEDGSIMNITGGTLYGCKITGAIKGEKGAAGELKGTFKKAEVLGDIQKNVESGVFGKITGDLLLKNAVKVGIGTPKIGNATIISTVDGEGAKEYSISIIKAENPITPNKNIIIKITDESLIEKTGGIVQGMSGSPILQDGKIVGAVTHVFINDPLRGFGISINNMLNS